VSKKPQKRVKHIPQRTCIGCRTVLSKRTLIRIVRTDEGVKVDPTGKVPGRGAYIHGNRSCWERALKGPIGSALKTELTDADRQSLNKFMQSLPVEPETTNGEQQ
jgi:uncharacterized protein